MSGRDAIRQLRKQIGDRKGRAEEFRRNGRTIVVPPASSLPPPSSLCVDQRDSTAITSLNKNSITIGILCYDPQTAPGQCAPPTVGQWDPTTCNTRGLTGSEEAVVYLSRALALKENVQIIVYGDPPIQSEWRQARQQQPLFVHSSSFHQSLAHFPQQIVICWFKPSLVVVAHRAGARRIFLWMHCVLYEGASAISKEWTDRCNGILWLSRFQQRRFFDTARRARITLPAHFSEREIPVGNGVFANGDDKKEILPRANPASCIYASNYSQGLATLLNIWPRIRKVFPQATLDIFYGWQSWTFMKPHEKQRMLDQLTTLKEHGVNEHGQVGHARLQQEFARCSILAYPCSVEETFCITGIRAQWEGCLPCVISSCALRENIAPEAQRYIIESKDENVYLDLLLKCLRDASNGTISLETRVSLSNYVEQNHTWQLVARRVFQQVVI